MSVDPSEPKPIPSRAADPHPDYAHAHDAQAERARWELWAIVAVVVVVIVGAVAWRAATGRGPGPQAGVRPGDPGAAPTAATTAAAGAGVPPHGLGAPPPPRPIAP